MTITYRADKGSGLTNVEIDNNFHTLDNRTAKGWADLVQDVTINPGAAAPTIDTYRNGIIAYAFPAGTVAECFANFHIGHDYAVTGGDVGYEGMVYPHVHWTSNTTSTGVVRWGVEYTLARRGDSTGVRDFGATSTIYIEHTVGAGEQYRHHVSEAATGLGIPGTDLEVDALILCRFFRDATHPNDTYPDQVFLLTVDIHYPCDTFATPKRQPPFF